MVGKNFEGRNIYNIFIAILEIQYFYCLEGSTNVPTFSNWGTHQIGGIICGG
jgi:hypothetical protein